MPLYQLLTDRTLAEASAITPTTLIHIVTTADTRQNPAGSSYKAELGQLVGLFGGTFTGGTVSGATNFTGGLSANTISATTYLNLPQFSGGSGNCIADLYVSNIHSCSPLNINPLDEGNVYFGSTSGVTVDVTNSRLGIGTNNPQYPIEVISNNSQLFYNPTSSGGLLVVSGQTSIPRMGVIIPSYLTNPSAAVTLGLRAWDDITYTNYGNVGDTFLRATDESNGLNLINSPGVGTQDYIRFYAGNQATATPDIHIQGSGATRGYVGIGTVSPSEILDVNGKTKTTNFQMTSGANNGYVLTSDASGNASWQASTGGGTTFTGGTVTGSTSFTNGLTANTISATTYFNLPVTADTFTTAFTYSNNVFTISRNQGLSSLTATISTVTGFTVNGDLTITGNTNIGGGLTANTISATTYLNLPVPSFFNPGTASTINWDVSGVSNNYTATLTASTTTINVSNIRNGEYATIILTQDSVGSRTITLGTINGTSGSGRHKVSSGGGGSIFLTSNPNAVDILSCVYDGNILYWTVGNDYT